MTKKLPQKDILQYTCGFYPTSDSKVESVGVCTKITSILWLIVINLQAIIFTNS